MKLKSFGCSLIFGTDLHDDGRDGTWATPSEFSWPALVAKQLKYDYECHARPGSGNLQIWEKLINSLTDPEPALYVIGWTWVERFDYIIDPAAADGYRWPGHGAIWRTLMPINSDTVTETYYKHLHSEHRDKLTSLQSIKSALDLLRAHGHSFIMTYMDDLVLDQRWNVSPGMKPIQDELGKYLTKFDGKNFVDYSRDRGHEISKTMHPLESAHEDAAELVLSNLSDYVKS